MSSDADRAVIQAANDTAAPVDPATVLEAIWAHADARGERVAVVEGTHHTTYGQLWASAQSVRADLADAGIAPGDVVALAGERGSEVVAGVLGIWLAGAAYLPIDPQHPRQRIDYLLADSGAKAVLARPSAAAGLGDRHRVVALPPVQDGSAAAGRRPRPPDPSTCAYLIYTSGSTGKPKGALITHLGLANFACHFAAELRAAPDDATLWMTTFAFDMAGTELYVPLVSGGRIVVAPDEAKVDGHVLRELIERHDVRMVQATPTTWRLVLDQVADVLPGRTVLCGGESAPVPLMQRLVATGCELHHLYGPTETTVWSTSTVLSGHLESPLSVGRPIRNTQVMVVDAHGEDLPIGVQGEVCIAGSGVALGYHNRPELTAQRFGEHPVHGRFYRTGDLGRWRADGALELLGRSDRQVKLRGNRVELGEVEQALLAHPDVRAAAVVVVGDPSSDAVLTAFVEAVDRPGTTDMLWEHTRARLPRAMVPHQFAVVDALPVNANQKVDYPALARSAQALRTTGGPREEPAGCADGLAGRLTEVWRQLLDRDDVDGQTNFFAHGGHSLLGALLLQQVETLTGVALALGDLFANPTPDELAGRIRSSTGATAPLQSPAQA